MSEMPKWGNIRIRQDLIDRVADILKTEQGQKHGYSNVSQFTDYVLRKSIDEMEKSLNHINMYEDHVKIMDRQLDKMGRIVSVYFKAEELPWCDYCEENDCIHVQYAWEIPEARKILEGYGLQQPPSRRP